MMKIKIRSRTDGFQKTFAIPNALLLNPHVIRTVLKKYDVDLDLRMMLRTLKDYADKHPDFEIIEILHEDKTINITL